MGEMGVHGRQKTHLCADCAGSVDEGCIDELGFDLLDIWIVDGATDESLERTDGVLEIRGLLGLGGLADCTLLGTERNERPGAM
jgi:hypothetical protein